MNRWLRVSLLDGARRQALCAEATACWATRLASFIKTLKIMARGWESKSVEDQMEEARRSQAEAIRRVQSSEERERKRKIESLRLERSRLIEQLNRARSAAHQQMI